jgi:hypothetical protein
MSFHRLTFAAGLAAGFVAGTRAGRERYDQMVKAAKAAKESPAFQQAAGAVQAQASGLLSSAGHKVADRAPRLAHSAMHSVSDHVPLLKGRNGDSSANGKDGNDRPFAASGNGHSSAATD